MYVRYSNCSNITAVFQSVDVLLEWCEMDPVDTWEMGRNEVVYAKQGNRNVFIDYPELAWKLYGREVPSGMTTPSGGAASDGGSSGGSSSGGGNTDVPVSCTHATTEIRGRVSATCGTAGYTGDTYCKSCGEKTASGTTIAATGNHTWGEPVVVTPPTETAFGIEKSTCTMCSATKTTHLPPIGTSGGETPDIPDDEIELPDTPDVPTTPDEPDFPEQDPLPEIDEMTELLGSIATGEDRLIVMINLGLLNGLYYDLVADKVD